MLSQPCPRDFSSRVRQRGRTLVALILAFLALGQQTHAQSTIVHIVGPWALEMPPGIVLDLDRDGAPDYAFGAGLLATLPSPEFSSILMRVVEAD